MLNKCDSEEGESCRRFGRAPHREPAPLRRFGGSAWLQLLLEVGLYAKVSRCCPCAHRELPSLTSLFKPLHGGKHSDVSQGRLAPESQDEAGFSETHPPPPSSQEARRSCFAPARASIQQVRPS